MSQCFITFRATLKNIEIAYFKLSNNCLHIICREMVKNIQVRKLSDKRLFIKQAVPCFKTNFDQYPREMIKKFLKSNPCTQIGNDKEVCCLNIIGKQQTMKTGAV